MDFQDPEKRDEIEEQVEAVLEDLREYIHGHGGEILFSHIDDDGFVVLELMGHCDGCPMSMMTLKMGIERKLREHFPDLPGVRAANEQPQLMYPEY